MPENFLSTLPLRTLPYKTRRYEEFQRADAASSSQGLVHNLCATPSSTGPLLWACSGAGAASIYNIQSKSLVRKVGATKLLLGATAWLQRQRSQQQQQTRQPCPRPFQVETAAAVL